MSTFEPVSLQHLEEAAAALDILREKADEHDLASLSPRSVSIYAADWRQFEAWCDRYGLLALPADPETVRLYLTDLAIQVGVDGARRYKASTIEQHVAAISYAHHRAGFGRGVGRHERVTNALAGIRRIRAEAPDRKTPLLLEDVRRIVDAMTFDKWPSGVSATRDWFAILFGFTTAMRRSEIAALLVEDVVLHPSDGIHVRIRKSKTDQEGHGAIIGVPFGSRVQTCLPCALVRWLRLVEAPGRADRMRLIFESPFESHVCRGSIPQVPKDTPLFRRVDKTGRILDGPITDTSLNALLKRRLTKAGYDSSRYSAHSLRAGFVTQARRNGATARNVRLQTRHGSDEMVDVYDREFRPLTDENAVWQLGL